MNVSANSVRQYLAAGELCIGLGVRVVRTPEIVRLAQGAGYRWLFIDLEHGPFSIDTASQIAVAALGSGVEPFVRVPRGEHAMATRMLDNGAFGIVCPMLESADEAREIVRRLKYPPIGQRSISSNMPQFGYQVPRIDVLTERLNRECMIVAMIETRAGLAAAHEIAAVPGIDILLIGTNDLCANLGLHGQYDHPEVDRAYRDVIDACHKNGLWAGMGGIRQHDLMRRHIDQGVRFVLVGSDLSVLARAARLECSEVQALAPLVTQA
jgi:2-keto-3-deoxy-L-rhamnonate aldolase RhmA